MAKRRLRPPRSGFESEMVWLIHQMAIYFPAAEIPKPVKRYPNEGKRLIYDPYTEGKRSFSIVQEKWLKGVSPRKRFTDNLNPLCTREIFRLTKHNGITNNQLLDILHRKELGAHKERISTSLVRLYRDPKTDRTIKLKYAKYLILRLVTEGFISNADALKAWYFCVINYSLMQAISTAPAKMATPRPELIANARIICKDLLETNARKNGVRSSAKMPGATAETFINLATILYFREDCIERDLMETKRKLYSIAEWANSYLLSKKA